MTYSELTSAVSALISLGDYRPIIQMIDLENVVTVQTHLTGSLSFPTFQNKTDEVLMTTDYNQLATTVQGLISSNDTSKILGLFVAKNIQLASYGEFYEENIDNVVLTVERLGKTFNNPEEARVYAKGEVDTFITERQSSQQLAQS